MTKSKEVAIPDEIAVSKMFLISGDKGFTLVEIACFLRLS
jgi:hypothetical protein